MLLNDTYIVCARTYEEIVGAEKVKSSNPSKSVTANVTAPRWITPLWHRDLAFKRMASSPNKHQCSWHFNLIWTGAKSGTRKKQNPHSCFSCCFLQLKLQKHSVPPCSAITSSVDWFPIDFPYVFHKNWCVKTTTSICWNSIILINFWTRKGWG